jgi:hypothetical protein
LKAAVANPRIARPYGSGKDDYGFEDIGVRGVNTHQDQ